MKKKYKYYVAPLLAVVVSSSHGGDDGFVEKCRAEVQARLVKQDRIFTLIAAKIAGSVPLECRERYREQQRLSAIENTTYLTQRESDRLYRATLTKKLKTIDNDNDIQVLNYELAVQKSLKTPIDPGEPEMDLLKGYTNLRGAKNKQNSP